MLQIGARLKTLKVQAVLVSPAPQDDQNVHGSALSDTHDLLAVAESQG
jgi:hypothetical protein